MCPTQEKTYLSAQLSFTLTPQMPAVVCESRGGEPAGGVYASKTGLVGFGERRASAALRGLCHEHLIDRVAVLIWDMGFLS